MRNYQILLPIALVSAALFAGCASVGNNFDDSKVSQIKKGETTEAELIQIFGEPQNRNVNSEGRTVLILTWTYAESKVRGESFIPYAGAFMGGHDTKSKSLTVTLQDGKAMSFASSGGGMGSRGMTQDVPGK